MIRHVEPWDPDNSVMDPMDIPNYDGQGKSRRQEATDSAQMLGFVLLVGMIVWPILILLAWAMLR